jgi:hypothetical protein
MEIREVQTRLFVAAEQLRPTLAYDKAFTGGRCSRHFPFPERGLDLAAVSSPTASFLIIAGAEAAVAPFRSSIDSRGRDRQKTRSPRSWCRLERLPCSP